MKIEQLGREIYEVDATRFINSVKELLFSYEKNEDMMDAQTYETLEEENSQILHQVGVVRYRMFGLILFPNFIAPWVQ